MATGEGQLSSSLFMEVELDLRREYEEGGLKAVYVTVEEKLNKYCKIPLSVAITGQTGAGKSAFINALRGLKAGQPGAAPIGVTRTTVGRTAYPDLKNPNFIYWDLPAIHSTDFPRETYLEQIDFLEYDAYIILTRDHFKESDLWLAQEVRKLNKKFFFARTSVHRSIQDQKEASVHSKSEKEYLEEMRKEIKDNLGDLYQEESVFLIDSLKPRFFHFDRLKARLVQKLPKLKRDALEKALTVTGEKVIELKVETIRRDWLPLATAGSGFVGLLLSVPFVSTTLLFGAITRTVLWMAEQMALQDDPDLAEFEVAQAFVMTTAKELGMGGTVAAVEGARFAPIIGSLVSAAATTLGTKSLLEAILEKLLEKAKKKLQDKIKLGINRCAFE